MHCSTKSVVLGKRFELIVATIKIVTVFLICKGNGERS